MLVRLLALVILVASPAMADPFAGSLVDLTHPFDDKTIFWPTEEGFVLDKGHAGMTEQGYYYAAHKFRTAEHGGTHIDAPIHFAEKGDTLDQVPLERLVGPGVRVDVSKACAADRDHRIDMDDLHAWEKQHGKIPERSIVLLETGFGRFWPDRKKYLGTDERGETALAKLSFPGLDAAAAKWLIDERKIRAVGIDTASIDHGRSTDYAAHVALFTENVPAFENVAHLDKLPVRGFTIIALPMKITGGSGGPLRIVAALPK